MPRITRTWLAVLPAAAALLCLGSISGLAQGPNETARAALLRFSRNAPPMSAEDLATARALRTAARAAAGAPTGPVTPFSFKGQIPFFSVEDDSCFVSGACNASQNNCVCYEWKGKVNATQIGKAALETFVTVNMDDCVNNGDTGVTCCPMDGEFLLDSKSNRIFGDLPGGLACIDSTITIQPISLSATYTIVPIGTGKFANSEGAGQYSGHFQGNGTTNALFLNVSGMIQVK
jgi:hypothetical protein